MEMNWSLHGGKGGKKAKNMHVPSEREAFALMVGCAPCPPAVPSDPSGPERSRATPASPAVPSGPQRPPWSPMVSVHFLPVCQI